jgi:DNA-binding NtrC family response regulator
MVKRLLVSVIDDDEFVRESLPDLLREFGFEVRAFSSAEEFLASDCAGQTSCQILDIALPGMSGPTLQRELSRRGQGFRLCSSRLAQTNRSVRAYSKTGRWSACSNRSATQLARSSQSRLRVSERCISPCMPGYRRA